MRTTHIVPSYKRLSQGEREEISIGLGRGEPPGKIASRIGRHPSTVCREVARLSDNYRATGAGVMASRSASSRKLGKTRLFGNPTLRDFVLEGLRNKWSPKQVCESLRIEYPADMTMRISPETIYRSVYVLPRGSLKKELVAGLRQEHAYRRKRKGVSGGRPDGRGKIADMLSIEERPAEADGRSVPGHWEGDLILGRHKRSALATLVERTTRHALLVPLRAKDAVSVRKALAREMRALPKTLAKTLTYDQGKEMSDHVRFTVATGIKVYFAHPGSPWERGTNENTNGLIRQYFPKGTDFHAVSRHRIKEVQRSLNTRPRAALQFRTPLETFTRLVALNSGD